jgi:hypothetical protein
MVEETISKQTARRSLSTKSAKARNAVRRVRLEWVIIAIAFGLGLGAGVSAPGATLTTMERMVGVLSK